MSFSKTEDFIWWKHGVIYHIYPLSFFDSNADGIGDLVGINSKLDYLQNLGVDAIWLSPVYKSPMLDFGYDVENYLEIDPVFGKMEDFKELISNAHNRGIKVIMDLILNHTSDQHPWFLESKSSRSSFKRDWYIWKDPKRGGRPNNWSSALGGSAWAFDPKSSQYYLHSFLPEQPDLNWENTEMQRAFFDDIIFWLDLGVDGFRLDAINMIGKDPEFRNNPMFFGLFSNSMQWKSRNQARSYQLIKDLRKLLDLYDEKVLIGEIYALPPGNPNLAASYLNSEHNGLHLTFDFSIVFRYWSARMFHTCFEKSYSSIPLTEWACIVFSNHDLNRSFNRPFTGHHKYQKAIIKAVLQLTLKGTPFIYYGEEIGMPNSNISRKQLTDPIGKKFWPFYEGRDAARTPMQWDDSKHAGFTKGTPWLPVDKDYLTCNVEAQQLNPDSLLKVYEHLIKLRKQYPALQFGEWRPLNKGERDIWIYDRVITNETITVIINFVNKKRKLLMNAPIQGQIIFTTIKNRLSEIEGNLLFLDPYEVILIKRKAEKQIV
ncbi:MAG: alpha-glucosidase [Bacteroidota bacterium]